MNENVIDYGNKNIYRNSIYSMIYKIISAILSFVSAPLLLYCLGDERYGAWAAMLSLISWVYYCDLGIGNGLRNKLAGSLVMNDYESSRKFLGISYALIFGITTIFFLAALIISYFFDYADFLDLEFSDENINLCLVIAILFACINFVLSLSNSILYALQRAGLVSLFSVIGQALFIILLAIYAVTGIHFIFYMAIGEGICQLLKNLVETIYVFNTNPKLKFSVKDIDIKYSSSILSFGLQMFLVQIAALILNSTDNLVITKLLGPAAVTPYNFCFKYFNMFNTFYAALITPLLSAYTAAYTRKDLAWILSSLKKNAFLYILFSIGTIGAIFIFKPFTLIWLQKEMEFEKGLILSTALYFIVLMFNHLFSTFLTGISRIRETTIVTVIGTIINIPVSVFLAKNAGLGTTGVMLGSLVSIIIGVWAAPIITFKEIKKMRHTTGG